MRQRLFRLAAGALAAASLIGGARTVSAQDDDGALFLLLPVGARSIGMGQAVVATAQGSEAVWWNPAALARLEKREAAIHHSTTFVATGDAISLVIPSTLLGVITASINILDFGTQALTDEVTGQPFGSLTVRNIVYAGSYATPIGSRLNAGLSYKLVQLRFDCNPSCGDVNSVASTSALDAGMQYELRGWAPVTLGVALRNFGPRLQVRDSPQADNLPTRLHVGVRYSVGGIERYAKDTEIAIAGDLIGPMRFNDPTALVGADISWRDQVHVRGGYIFEPAARSDGSGPSIGFGLVAGDLVIDIARMFQGLSADAGKAPTYFSLRLLF